jgi:nucleoside-diphosphate-sugar epimerase
VGFRKCALEELGESNMRVLVTGHRGYIGTVLVPLFLDAGHEVVGLDSDLYSRCTFGNEPLDVPTIEKDIRDVTVDDLYGFDTICHLAGLSNDPLGDLDPDLTFDINYHATVRLGELAKRAGVNRFIFSSSCSCYGASDNGLLTEESPLNPVTPYAQSKILSEDGLRTLSDDDFSPVFLRNATAYGVSPRLRFDLVLNNLVAWAFTTGKIRMKSDGSPWRPIVHIEDISRAFLVVAEAPQEKVHEKAFNVGRNEDNLQVRDIALIVQRTMPHCEVSFAEDASPDKRNYRVDCSRLAREIPAFQPQWTAIKGARELIAAYQQVGITRYDFEGPRFQRVGHIRKLLMDGVLNNDLRHAIQKVS